MKKATHFSHRLSFRQAHYALIVAFITGMIFSILQIALDYRHQDQAIDEEMSALLEISSAPAARIAYNIDSELAQELLNGLLLSPNIISAEIRDETGQRLGYLWKDSRQDQARWISDSLFDRTRTYRHELRVDYDPEEPLGYLQLEVDTFYYGDTFLRRATTTFLTGLIKGLSMALILLLLFYRMLTKPLAKLSGTLSQLRTSESSSARLTCPEGHQHDEIGMLTEEINNLLYAISSNSKRRFRAERQLRDHLATLENTVASRTAELHARNKQLTDSNSNLDKARQDALKMAQERATMLASMSHEIRTPLSSLLGMVDLAMSHTKESNQRHRLALAHEAGFHLLQMLNDILDFSRVESGKLLFESIPFNLHQSLEKTVEMFSQQAHQKNLWLQCVICPSVPEHVKGDPTRLQQIMTNLISNAIKFTSQGQVAVLTKLINDKGDGHFHLSLSVEDTGIGVAEDRIEEIFHPFSQASNATNRLFGGHGLGLALSRNMAEAMGGTLQYRERAGRGSCFTMTIPYERDSSHPIAQTPEKPSLTNRHLIILTPYLLAMALNRYIAEAGSSARALSWYGPWQPETMKILSSSTVITTLPDNCMTVVPEHRIPVSQQMQDLKEDFSQLILAPVRQKAVKQILQQLGHIVPDDLPVPEANPQEQTEQNHDVRILIVEDNPTNMMVTQGMLIQLGYKIGAARNGQQCLDICKKETFDLILMDCNMPVMNGYNASRYIRSDPSLCHIPIIALTANAFEHDRDRCLQNGMQAYLSKPFDRKDLEATIHRWLTTPVPQEQWLGEPG